jgi:hypothetical protein
LWFVSALASGLVVEKFASCPSVSMWHAQVRPGSMGAAVRDRPPPVPADEALWSVVTAGPELSRIYRRMFGDAKFTTPGGGHQTTQPAVIGEDRAH